MKKLLLAVLLLVTTSTFAENCDQFYVGGKQIVIANTIELCSSFYVVAYSKEVKGPIASFDHISAGKVKVKRVNAFRPDTRLAPNERAELKDYVHSGFDRGHMTPAGDASTDVEMRDTFLLSNMTPQSKRLNEGNWKDLETHVRAKAAVDGAYVATIAIYGSERLGPNKIGVPIRYYKVIWYPNRVTDAFYADNRNDSDIMSTTIDKVNAETHLNLPK